MLLKEVGEEGSSVPPQLMKLKRSQWWILVFISTFFLIAAQAVAVLLGRFYYNEGGNSKWMSTIVQTAGFPILYLPLFLLPASHSSSSSSCSVTTLVWIYVSLGLVIALDNLLYSYGLLFLSASTYSLICATQLAFNGVFSKCINSQKFTRWIGISGILLSISAIMTSLDYDSNSPSSDSKWNFMIGALCTLVASLIYSLQLSLMQYSFENIIKRETFSMVLDMQIYTSLVATCVSVIGLFVSGEWKLLRLEMKEYHKGQVSFLLTLIGTAVSWQLGSVGAVALIFLVSSLFSNLIGTLSLTVTPLAAFLVFHDKLTVVKLVAILVAVLGFAFYIYQNYLDDLKAQRAGETQAD